MPRVYSRYDPARPANAVYIGRAGKGVAGPYGNDHKVEIHGLARALELYEKDVKGSAELRNKLKAELKDKDLVCFCAARGGIGPDDPLVCHGQVIMKAIRGDYDG